MKKVSSLLLYVCLALLCVMTVACGSNNKDAGADNAEESGETAKESGETADGITIIPIVFESSHIPLYAFPDGAYALMYDSRYVMFNNDDDYQEYCMLINFLKGCEASLKRKLENKYQVRSFSARTWDTTYTAEEINRIIIDARVNLVSDVLRYVQGKKDQISDPEIFELIDRVYYDTHPFQQNFNLSDSRYNQKCCSSQSGNIFVKPASELKFYEIIRAPYDTVPVPAGTLLLY